MLCKPLVPCFLSPISFLADLYFYLCSKFSFSLLFFPLCLLSYTFLVSCVSLPQFCPFSHCLSTGFILQNLEISPFSLKSLDFSESKGPFPSWIQMWKSLCSCWCQKPFQVTNFCSKLFVIYFPPWIQGTTWSRQKKLQQNLSNIYLAQRSIRWHRIM